MPVGSDLSPRTARLLGALLRPFPFPGAQALLTLASGEACGPMERGPSSSALGGSSRPPGSSLCISLAQDKHFLFPIDYAQILLPFSSIPGMLSSFSSHREKSMHFRIPRPAPGNGLSADRPVLLSGHVPRGSSRLRGKVVLTCQREGRARGLLLAGGSVVSTSALQSQRNRRHLPGRA